MPIRKWAVTSSSSRKQPKESLRGDDNLLDTVYNDENRIPTNNYFLEHPEHIIHTTTKLDTDPFGKPAMIYTHEGGVEGIAEDCERCSMKTLRKPQFEPILGDRGNNV